MKNKIFIKIVLIIIFLIFITSGNVKAAYQSTPYTHANPQSQKWDAWLTAVRTMETTGGAFGLEETLSGTNATSQSNNIDVHMAKATEYGAVAILSASGYGNLNNTTKPETSTADTAAENKTGIFYNYNNWEFTACISAVEVGNSFSRYWDKYNTLSLRGLSPSGWHGGTNGQNEDSTGLYNKAYNMYMGGDYIKKDWTPTGYHATRCSVGKNGIFTYNWATSGAGYIPNGDNPKAGNAWYPGAYYSDNSQFYARGAVVNMTGI